jgi:hypothetical protein
MAIAAFQPAVRGWGSHRSFCRVTAAWGAFVWPSLVVVPKNSDSTRSVCLRPKTSR